MLIKISVLAIWVFVSCPLVLLGTVVGKNWNGTADYPCRINQVECTTLVFNMAS